MFAAGAALPFPRADLERERLLDPAHNLRVGAALLAMWEAEHVAIDRAIGSTPHRTAVAHFFWGDKVWGATPEDRTLTARRRLLEAYGNAPVAFQPSSLGLAITSPLEGAPRLGTSGLGVDRDGGERSHRGVDIDATIGEPVRAVADGVVQFAGVDMTGDHPALGLFPRQLKRWRRKTSMMGPGGFFVRIMHEGGVRSGYFHLNSFRVEAGQTVRAGEVIGTVGRTRREGLGQPPALRGPPGRRAEGSGALPVRVRAAARRHHHLRDREGREEAAAGARGARAPAGAGSGAEPFELERECAVGPSLQSVASRPWRCCCCRSSRRVRMTALVETKQGRRVEARILGGSPGSVYLAGDNHERFTIRRDEIADVDFPGNVMMVGGGALTAFGAYRLWFGDTTCGGAGQARQLPGRRHARRRWGCWYLRGGSTATTGRRTRSRRGGGPSRTRPMPPRAPIRPPPL